MTAPGAVRFLARVLPIAAVAVVLLFSNSASREPAHRGRHITVEGFSSNDYMTIPRNYFPASFAHVAFQNTSKRAILLERIEVLGADEKVRILGTLTYRAEDQNPGPAWWHSDCGFPPGQMVSYRVAGFPLGPQAWVGTIVGFQISDTTLRRYTVASRLRVFYREKASSRQFYQDLPHGYFATVGTHERDLCHNLPPAKRQGIARKPPPPSTTPSPDPTPSR